jgi:LytS/YehU family sensor histidine kinase
LTVVAFSPSFSNSLNNLYALTLKKSDLAPRVVLMLSDILRYVLYESNQGQVSILKEIKHIKDYIEIERLRLGNMVRVEIEISDQISDQNIEPMLVRNHYKILTNSEK